MHDSRVVCITCGGDAHSRDVNEWGICGACRADADRRADLLDQVSEYLEHEAVDIIRNAYQHAFPEAHFAPYREYVDLHRRSGVLPMFVKTYCETVLADAAAEA